MVSFALPGFRRLFLYLLFFEYMPRHAENKMFPTITRNYRCCRAAWRAPAVVCPQEISPAAILIDSPRMAALKKKLMTDCAATTMRIGRVITATSEVCTATAMVNEKYRKSQ